MKNTDKQDFSRSRRQRNWLMPAWSALSLCLACREFPESLQDQIEADEGAAGARSEHTTSGHDSTSGPMQELADFCVPEDTVPVVEAGHNFMMIPIGSLDNDLSSLTSCGLDRKLVEPDGFLAVHMEAGQRWHVRVNEAQGHDIALYVLPECDERTCVVASDRCPASTAEHFNFVPDTSGTYLIGIDGIGTGDDADTMLEVAVMMPMCGDGEKGHSEVCDDGNRESGDGCDSECRVELDDATAEEVEPNDDLYTANVLPPATERVELFGQVGGTCDTDVFLFDLEAEQHVEVELTDAFGQPCQNAPNLTFQMANERGQVVARETTTDGSCPSLHIEEQLAEAVGAGRFTVSLSAPPEVALLDYRLVLTRHGHEE